MYKLIAAAVKELLLLKRDRTGLLVLFAMPAILVMVITLVQENVMELTGQKKNRMVFLDMDGGDLGVLLQHQLVEGYFQITAWDAERKNSEDIRAAVTGGEYQVGVVIPEDSSVRLEKRVTGLFKKSKQQDGKSVSEQVPVQVFFDPALLPGLRSAITAQLQVALETVAMEEKVGTLGSEINRLLSTASVAQNVMLPPAEDIVERFRLQLLTLEESADSSGSMRVPPYNPVQQNVPAWALFGMFFTAIPIAGTILQERRSGIWNRLTSMPVSHIVLFSGKVLAYTGVCFCQFLLVGVIGSLFFPYLGLPAFTFGHGLLTLLLVVLCSGLAACGYGIFLGTVCSSYEQVSALGSITVVLAAAIGGVMVPVYAMPLLMQKLSVISPLNWGLTAFHDLLVRGYSFSAIRVELGCLILFFLLTLFAAWKLART